MPQVLILFDTPDRQVIIILPADGFINPYGRMGPVGANIYNPGNMVDGSPLGAARAVGRQLMP